MVAGDMLDYYRRQSHLTNPGALATLYDDLPRDVPGLTQVIQNVLVYPAWLSRYGVEPGEIDDAGFGVRRVEDLLRRVQRRAGGPLTTPRPPADRLGVNCRNFGVLLVSMLRHQGTPARLRVGFAGYFVGPVWYDHRLAEYWDAVRQRWVLADPMIDRPHRDALGIAYDTLDLGPADPFLPAGVVWRRCRAGDRDPEGFGDGPTDRGMAPIRYALLHDFAALNKLEVLGGDDWGELITKPEATLTTDDRAMLDRVAALTLVVDAHHQELLALFEETAYGRSVRAALAALM